MDFVCIFSVIKQAYYSGCIVGQYFQLKQKKSEKKSAKKNLRCIALNAVSVSYDKKKNKPWKKCTSIPFKKWNSMCEQFYQMLFPR